MRPLHLTPASEATRQAVQDDAPRSARDPNFKQFIKRVPELKLAAQQLMAGELSKEQYGRLVEQYRPVSEYTHVPVPATDADLREALNSKQMEKIGVPAATLATGDRVGLRLDIPAYERHGVWAVSVHEQQAGFAAGKVIGYDSVAAVTSATLGVVQKAALKIAAGTSKSTIAVIKGNWLPLSPEEAVEVANSALTDPAWRQVGMHPERHAYFFDRGNLRPVTAAETVIQVGPLVLAKNVTYGSMDDVLFSRAAPTVDVERLARPGTNSDGRPLGAANEDALHAFWNWFGDSKVVDKQGRPLVVYHGTQDSFDSFDPATQGKNVNPSDVGFFFTNYLPEADTYANWSSTRQDAAPNIMPVYLAMENPLRVDLSDVGYDSPAAWYDAAGNDVAREAIKDGHDGLIVNDSDDDFNMPDGTKQTMYVVFAPKQIKSATGNAGNFDADNPDIRFSRAGALQVGGAQRPTVPMLQHDEVRRSPADRPFGNARPVDPSLLDQRVPPAIEAILRNGRKSGGTTINGLSALRQAMREIGATGPQEVRPLAAMVKQLLPVDGTVLLTVDDHSLHDLHGALALDPVLHLTLFTAPPRAGLNYSTLFHESLHVCVGARYRSLAAALRHGGEKGASPAAEALALFHSIWNEFRAVSTADGIENPALQLAVNEARSSPDEFFVRSLTDPMLQSYLAAKRYEGRTLWQKFTGWVKSSLFGFDDAPAAPSWLDAALDASGNLVNGLFRHGGNDMANEDEQGADDEEVERDTPRC